MSEHYNPIPSPAGPEQGARGVISRDQMLQEEADIFARQGDTAYVNAVRDRMDYVAGANRARDAGRNAGPVFDAANREGAVSGNMPAVGHADQSATKNTASSKYGAKSNNQMAEEVDWEIDDSDVYPNTGTGEVQDAIIVSDPTETETAESQPAAEARGTESRDARSTTARPHASKPYTSTTIAPIRKNTTASPGSEDVPSAKSTKKYGDFLAEADHQNPEIDALQADVDAALEKWARLSAKRAGAIFFGKKKQVNEAYKEYLELQNQLNSAKVGAHIRTLTDAGIDRSKLTAGIDELYQDLKLNAAFNAAEKRTEIRKELAADFFDNHKLAGKFVQSWASWGGKKENGKTNWSGKFKKMAVMGGFGLVAGTAIGALTVTGVGAGVGAAAGLVLSKAVARGLGGAKLDAKAAASSDVVADAQHERHVTEIESIAKSSPAVSLEDLTGHINTRTNEEISRNRKRAAVGTAIGAAAGGLGSWGAHALIDHFSGSGSTEQFAKIPETNTTPGGANAEKVVNPEFEPVTMTVHPGDGLENVMTDYAADHHVDLSGGEVHRMFLEGREADLFDKAHTADNFSGSKPMDVGGGVGFAQPGETTLSADTVEFLDKELSEKVVTDYIADHNLDVNVTDAKLHALIEQAYQSGAIKPGEVISDNQVANLIGDLS